MAETNIEELVGADIELKNVNIREILQFRVPILVLQPARNLTSSAYIFKSSNS